jgi:lysozyme family protein
MGFNEAWAETSAVEKGYANLPGDVPTNHGISEPVARENGYFDDMKQYPKAEADRVAKLKYWDTLKLDDVAALSPKIANEIFDSGFLCGIGTSAKFLQTSLTGLNREQKDYPDLEVDGNIGAKTIAALKAFLTFRKADGELVMLLALNGLQIAYLFDVVNRNKKNEDFIFGWLLKRTQV